MSLLRKCFFCHQVPKTPNFTKILNICYLPFGETWWLGDLVAFQILLSFRSGLKL